MSLLSAVGFSWKKRAFPKTKRLKIKRDLRGEYDPRVFNPRYILQRAKYGFCEADALFISRWFCRVAPDMLEYMADEKNLLSYPSRLEYEYWERHKDEIGVDFIRFSSGMGKTDGQSRGELEESFFKQWQEILRRAAFLIRESFYSDGENDGKDGEEYRDNCEKEGMELFSKWFGDLWSL